MEKLLVEFVSQMSTTGTLLGTFESTERLLNRFLPGDRVNSVMEEIRGPAGRTMWDKLGNVNESVLANYLKNEYPQTVAVVLSRIKSEHAARVLGALPEDFALEVVQRMLRMESVQKDILEKVEQTLRTEFMSSLARTQKRDSHEMMAEIFNNFDRNTEASLMGKLEERDTEAAERIRALMFTFEDLTKIDNTGIQNILRNIDKDKLSIALKGAPENMRDLFFSNMSERASKILKEDMGAMGPKMCTVVADCTGACPPASKGCTCSTNPMGQKICVPTCVAPADCPPGMNGQVLTCMQGVCVPPM